MKTTERVAARWMILAAGPLVFAGAACGPTAPPRDDGTFTFLKVGGVVPLFNVTASAGSNSDSLGQISFQSSAGGVRAHSGFDSNGRKPSFELAFFKQGEDQFQAKYRAAIAELLIWKYVPVPKLPAGPEEVLILGDPSSAIKLVSRLNYEVASDADSLPYHHYIPATHTFYPINYLNQGSTRGARIYKHGQCSVFQPWSAIFEQVGPALTDKLACGILGAGATSARREVVGLLPTFDTTPAAKPIFDLTITPDSTRDGFGLYALFTYEAPLFMGGEVVLHGQYTLTAEGGNVRVFPAAYPDSILSNKEKAQQRLTTDVPAAVESAINGQLGRKLPEFPKFGGPSCDGKPKCAGPPPACDRHADQTNVQAQCASAVSGFFQSAVSLAAGNVFNDPSRYTCDQDCTSVTGASCTYHFPVARVNGYPDGFELVFAGDETDVGGPMSIAAQISTEAASLCDDARVSQFDEPFSRAYVPTTFGPNAHDFSNDGDGLFAPNCADPPPTLPCTFKP